MKIFRSLGFSLVELSVVLAVMGITLAGGLTVATQNTETAKVTTTTARLDAIQAALARYVLDSGNSIDGGGDLPCPADIDLPMTDGNFGITAQTGANCTNGNYGSPNATGVYAGGVPVRTLNLPDEYANDGHGRRILYVVDNKFAKASAQFKEEVGGGIVVKNAAGGTETSEAVYALLSFGKNGHGAFGRNGGSSLVTSGSTDTDELQNCKCDATPTIGEVAFNTTFVKKSATNSFDDTLRYARKSDIISAAQGVTNTTICTAAAATGCATATSAANCQAMANLIKGWCLQ
jgi:prepilin-type N-terminal cleavage/methylation domain-containing protein